MTLYSLIYLLGNIIALCILIFIFWIANGKTILAWMLTGISWVQSSFNFLWMQFWYVRVVLKYSIWILPHFQRNLPVIMLQLYPAFCSQGMNIYSALSALTSTSNSLRATKKDSVFFFIVCIFLPNKFSSAQTKSWSVTFNFIPSRFAWNFLITYSNAKVQNNGD